ncbi:unnamed protein product, partial [Polarella glacialis]
TSLVRRGTWDQGVQNAMKKVKSNPHGGCVSNCHTFVAECLQEMRNMEFVDNNMKHDVLSYLLAIWLFLLGHFTTCPRTTLYIVPVVIGLAVIIGVCFVT